MPKATKSKEELKEDVAKVLATAEQKGINTNYFFKNTFKVYQTQMEILESLEAEFRESGVLVEKEYVRGRKNVYTNPAITEYNRTATATNNTVATLIKIFDSFSVETEKKQSKLESLIADE